MAEKQVVIITGGARGIGYACAQRFYDDGFHIVIADSDEVNGEDAASALERADTKEKDKRVMFVHCNVGERLSVHNLMARTLGHFGQIDVLINNAAVLIKGDILSLTPKDFDKVMSVNLRGAFLTSQAVAKYMVNDIEENDDRSGGGRRKFSIINMSSINAQVAMLDNLAYEVSKGGLNQLTKSLALSLAQYGIRVNAIGPGSVQTDMLSGIASDQTARDLLLSRTPLGRVAQPSEISSVAAFLASSDASYITGECIYVDGGRLALNYTMPNPNAKA